MVNLRVDDLAAMVEQLKAKGVEVLGSQAEAYGNSPGSPDCDGIKIERWNQLGPAPA